MAVLYIREQGTTVSKENGRIKIIKGGRAILERPVIGIDSVAVFGNVQITSQAMQMLLREGIDVEYFSFSGKYLGSLAANSSRNIFLRMQQYELYMNEEKRLAIARDIVRNKIDNQIRIIETHRWNRDDSSERIRNRDDSSESGGNGSRSSEEGSNSESDGRYEAGSDYDWKSDVRQMLRLRERLDGKVTPGSIMGIEGAVSNIYFHSYGEMFRCDFQFEKRSRRPPRNPINVILSLAYTLLTKEVAAALEAESFEMYMGFLHGIRYGRKSLALDIVEEFRQPVADRLVLKVFNKRMLTEADFETEEDQVILTENGFRTFCTAYEKWIGGADSTSGEKSFRSVIRAQTALLKKAVREDIAYIPYAWKKPAENEGAAEKPCM